MLRLLSLFFAGILAGEELVIRYGVHPALIALEDRSHVAARQALIRKLRVVVPTIFVATALSTVAVLIVDGTDNGFGLRCAAVLTLLAWVLITAIGTVPINSSALDWQPAAPPADWRATISRWGRLDVFRSSAAVLCFGFLLVAAALQAAAS